MANLNMVQIIGRCGQDPEMRFTPNGNPVTTFSVAVNEYYNDSGGEKQERTEWFNVVTWNKLAELANQYLVKGAQVYIQGRLQTRSWETPEGVTRYRTEIVAQKMQFIETARRQTVPEDEDINDLPF